MDERPRQASDRAEDKEYRPAPPTLFGLKSILRTVLSVGKLTWSPGFKTRCTMRGHSPGFNSVDAVNVIRRGRIVAGPRFMESKDKCSWHFQIEDIVEGYTFALEVALDCKEDYKNSPHLEVITGFFRRGRRSEIRDEAHHANATDEDRRT